jgi:hypothetical protein
MRRRRTSLFHVLQRRGRTPVYRRESAIRHLENQIIRHHVLLYHG